MESSWPETSVANREEAVEKLIRGREITVRLLSVLREPLKWKSPVSPKDLASEIFGSFSETISILSSMESDETSRGRNRNFEDSGQSRQNTVKKGRRCSYKSRNTSQTWTRESPAWVDDGFAWRKYGQKAILNAQYPRNYLRCSHKFDQGCKAIKQVQRVQEDPPIYRTIYHGHHTCKNLLKSQSDQILLDSTAAAGDSDSSNFCNFESTDHYDYKPKNDYVFPAFSSIEQEEAAADPLSSSISISSGSSYHRGNVISSSPARVYSCTRSMETTDTMVGSLDFQDMLKYEFQ